MTVDEINQFLRSQFPTYEMGPRVEMVGDGVARVRLPYSDRYLRPGGTISGPTMMMLADTVAYAVLLAEGYDAQSCVTANLNIHFFRRPRADDLIGIGQARKTGRRLSVIHVTIEDTSGCTVAEASVTYAMG